MTKRIYTGTLLVLFALLTVDLSAQAVAPGWRVATELPADSDLVGAWDVISGLDLDNDGFKEFIFSKDPIASFFAPNKSAGQSVYYYENTADDAYELRWSFTAPFDNTASNIYTAIAVGDLDQDGASELYFATPLDVIDSPPNPRGLYVFEFDGTNFPSTPSETWNMSRPDNHVFKLAGLEIGDVDKDGEMEIVICSRGPDDGAPNTTGRTLMVANSGGIDIGLGFGAFSVEFENATNQMGGSLYNARIVDFDGDGMNEIWAFTWDFWSLAIYEATGTNTYELQVDLNQLFNPIDFGNRRGMQFYDADGDGKLEFYQSGIVADGAAGSYVYYIANTADVSTLTANDVIQMGGQDLPYAGSAVGDVDADNLMDFFFIGRNTFDSGGSLHRMEYLGSGPLDQESSYEFTVVYEDTIPPSDLRNIAVGDLDGDDQTDILLTQLDALTTDDPILIVLESESSTGIEGEPIAVRSFVLNQNYPNPFNPSTTISFEINREEHVKLSVYNVLGDVVATLVDRKLSSGQHSVEFNASGLTSGTYYYTLETTGARQTRQMVLLK